MFIFYKEISRKLDKNPTTISREVRKYSQAVATGYPGFPFNSYKRKKLNNRTPYETFSFYYGEDMLKKLGCSSVPAGEIMLKPNLLKK